jgi:hypothetical protein
LIFADSRFSKKGGVEVDKFLIKLNRVIAYINIGLVVGLLITGFRMIGYFTFINRGLADYLHRIYFTVPFIILFTIHTLLSVRITLMRKQKKSVFLDILFIVIGIGFTAVFSYLALSLFVFFRR